MTDIAKGRYPARLVDEASEWLQLLDARSPGAEADFTRWISADPLHREVFDAVCANWADSEAVVEQPSGRTRKLVQAPFHMRRSTHVAAGACLALLFAASIVVAVSKLNQQAVIGSARAATFETGIGEIRTFALADGTTVTLDTGSLLATQPGEASVVELIRGRARFASRRADRVFTVTTAHGDVHARVARFDVSLIGPAARVATLEGRTELAINGRSGSALVLDRGEQGDMAPEAKVANVVDTQLLWVDGMLIFDRTPLAQAVDAINRYNRLRIEVPRTAEHYRVTGAFSARAPDAFAKAAAALFALKIDRRADNTIVLSPN